MARQVTPPDVFEELFRNPETGAPIQVDLDLIDDNPFQPRQLYDPVTLEELANSIERNGLQQPPAGRWVDGRMQLVFGHRRKRAFDLLRAKDAARWSTMPVVVVRVTDEDMAARAWTENVERADLTAIEQAQAIHTMVERFGWTQAKVAERLGLSAAVVSNKLRLLRAPDDVQQAVATGEISERQAAALMPIFDLPPEAIERAKSDGQGYGYRIDDLLKQAKQGQPSDSLRERADIVIRNATLSLKDEPWTTTDFGIAEERSRLCTTCAERVMHRGESRCSVQTCFQIKKQAWNDYQLAALVEAAGVPAMPVSVSYNDYHSFFGEDRRIAEEHGLNKPPLCDRLRVAQGTDGLLVPGVEGGKFICYHRGDKCRCLANIKRELSKDAKGRWKRIREQTKDALTAALSAPTPDTIRLLAGYHAYDKRDEVASWRMEDVVATIVKALMEQAQPYEPEKRIDEAQTAMANLLARAYITPPWSMYAAMAPAPDPLQQMRGRLELIRTWIGSQTVKHGAPSQEELQRIADNSQECLQELTGLPASVERDELARQLDAANQSAEEMISLVADGYDGSKQVAWIVNTPIGDLNAKSAVDSATREDLCWSLAVCRVLDQKKTTIEAIRSQLRKLDNTVVKLEGQRNAFPTSGGKRVIVHGWPTTKEEKLPGSGYIEPTIDREAPGYINAKLQKIAGWITDFCDPGDGLPTPESVAGNFVNLERLLEVIITQPSEEDQLKLKQLYDHVYASLAALSDRVNQSYALEQEN